MSGVALVSASRDCLSSLLTLKGNLEDGKSFPPNITFGHGVIVATEGRVFQSPDCPGSLFVESSSAHPVFGVAV